MSSAQSFNYFNISDLIVLRTSVVIWISTTGDDITGSGTESAPFANLVRAITEAKKYIIMDEGLITIRFKQGSYFQPADVDLYHPQGDRLIIEGDPSAIYQAYLQEVSGYSWNLSNFAGGGHTGIIKFGSSLSTHGITGANNGTYFSLTDASASSGYHDSVLNNGDYFFNMSANQENSHAILGIGRILNTSSGTTLGVEFHSPNIDTRCPMLETNGGLSSTLDWATIPNNYPSSQRANPNGTYSASVLGGTASNITSHGILLTTYPVIIRADRRQRTGTLFLRGGKLKALRNLFFTGITGGNGTPYTLSPDAAVPSWSGGFAAITDGIAGYNNTGTGLRLQDSKIAIRNLGFYGIGTAIASVSSSIKYYSDIESPTVANLGFHSVSSSLGELDNSPILCSAQCGTAILAKKSDIDFSGSNVYLETPYTDTRSSPIQLSTLNNSINITESSFSAKNANIECVSDIPKFKLDVVLPVFPGSTIAGASVGFNYLGASPDLWHTYKNVELIYVAPSGTTLHVGKIYDWRQFSIGITQGTISAAISGSTAGATIAGSPSSYIAYRFEGVKVGSNNESLSFMEDGDWRHAIDTSRGQMKINFYSGMTSTGASASYSIGPNSVLVAGHNGILQGFTAASGVTTSKYLLDFVTIDSTHYAGNRKAILATDNSSVVISKTLNIITGGNEAITITKNSKLVVGSGDLGGCLVSGWSDAAVSISENSNAIINNLFTKHPLHGSGAVVVDSNYSEARALDININSNVFVRKMYLQGGPKITNDTYPDGIQPLWKSRIGVKYGEYTDATRVPGVYGYEHIRISKNSNLCLSGQTYQMFFQDGGTANHISKNSNIILAEYGSSVNILGAEQTTTDMIGSKSSLVGIDSRTGNDRKIGTRSGGTGGIYGRSVRYWNGVTGDVNSVTGLNISLETESNSHIYLDESSTATQ